MRPSSFYSDRLRYPNIVEQPLIKLNKFLVLVPSFQPQCYSVVIVGNSIRLASEVESGDALG
jgi:hypothetical protein